MTARQVFEGLLTELSKVNAPSMLLLDFNYFFNKAINQYINKRYNIYDINQQTTDDLRVLKATTILPVTQTSVDTILNHYTAISNNNIDKWGAGNAKLFGATYEVNLPDDYLHMLNCICIYKLKKNYKCYNKDDYVLFAAKRLTADTWSIIVNDYYNRPLPERPYYYIHNINLLSDLPTNEYQETTYLLDNKNNTDNKYTNNVGTDLAYTNDGDVLGQSEYPRTVTLMNRDGDDFDVSLQDSTVAALRYANPTKVRCEIRYGKDNTVFELQRVFIDYIKAPLTIRLTQEQVDLTEDTSQIMEFPDYVCQEIINELVHLVMENTADPRLQTHIPVTQSIVNPTQQLTQTTSTAKASK